MLCKPPGAASAATHPPNFFLAQRAQNSLGNIFFSYKPLGADTSGIVSVFKNELYPAPALPPPVAAMRGVAVPPPRVTLTVNSAAVSHLTPGKIRGWLVYADSGGGAFKLRSRHPRGATTIPLQPGRWAISAAGTHDVESRGVLVDVP